VKITRAGITKRRYRQAALIALRTGFVLLAQNAM
jgi:hypothetical protein